MRDSLRSLLTDPIALFALVALVLWGFARGTDGVSERVTLRVDPLELAAHEQQRSTRAGRALSEAEQTALRAELLEREMLLQEAARMGLHLSDPELRHRLVERMRLEIAGLPAEPRADALVAFYAERAERYWQPERFRLEQVFFERELRAPATVLQALESRDHGIRGDRFAAADGWRTVSTEVLRGFFGAQLEQIQSQAAGVWFGPLRSTQGWHFLRIQERYPAGPRPFAAVEDLVRADFLAARSEAAVARYLSRLTRYDTTH